MHTNDHLFPVRASRRDFLARTSAATIALAVGAEISGCATSRPAAPPPVRLGNGHHTYEVVPNWGQLPAGMSFGLGCGVVVDRNDNVYVTSRSANPCVAVFDRHGHLLETWSNDFGEKVGLTANRVKETAHCLYWSREGNAEYFYWTENKSSVPADQSVKGIGRRVYKTDLKGKILYEIGNVAREGTTAQRFDWTNPTDVAVAANGDIYVVDGYGSQRVSRFDRNFRHLRTIGTRSSQPGPNATPATFNTCHGIWVSTLRNEPEIYIADRHNDRLQVFDLELNFKRIIKDVVRNPCCFYQHKKWLYIPDLASRVTILDAHDQVAAHLGDGKGAADNKTNPALFAAPHALCVDSHGDFYTVEWVDSGRPRKFRHTPQKV
jgi:sugar lactone lactonase YvrE